MKQLPSFAEPSDLSGRTSERLRYVSLIAGATVVVIGLWSLLDRWFGGDALRNLDFRLAPMAPSTAIALSAAGCQLIPGAGEQQGTGAAHERGFAH